MDSPKKSCEAFKGDHHETSEERKRVMEEEQKRTMNIIIHRAPESNEIEPKKERL